MTARVALRDLHASKEDTDNKESPILFLFPYWRTFSRQLVAVISKAAGSWRRLCGGLLRIGKLHFLCFPLHQHRGRC